MYFFEENIAEKKKFRPILQEKPQKNTNNLEKLYN